MQLSACCGNARNHFQDAVLMRTGGRRRHSRPGPRVDQPLRGAGRSGGFIDLFTILAAPCPHVHNHTIASMILCDTRAVSSRTRRAEQTASSVYEFQLVVIVSSDGSYSWLDGDATPLIDNNINVDPGDCGVRICLTTFRGSPARRSGTPVPSRGRRAPLRWRIRGWPRATSSTWVAQPAARC